MPQWLKALPALAEDLVQFPACSTHMVTYNQPPGASVPGDLIPSSDPGRGTCVLYLHLDKTQTHGGGESLTSDSIPHLSKGTGTITYGSIGKIVAVQGQHRQAQEHSSITTELGR